MHNPALFKGRHFEADIILCVVRWYLRYALSYRDVEELSANEASPAIIRLCFAGSSVMPPSSINGVDRHDNTLPEAYRLRPYKYLNNIVGRDHRLMKRRMNPGLGLSACSTA
jgi:transposase-like protein